MLTAVSPAPAAAPVAKRGRAKNPSKAIPIHLDLAPTMNEQIQGVMTEEGYVTFAEAVRGLLRESLTRKKHIQAILNDDESDEEG